MRDADECVLHGGRLDGGHPFCGGCCLARRRAGPRPLTPERQRFGCVSEDVHTWDFCDYHDREPAVNACTADAIAGGK